MKEESEHVRTTGRSISQPASLLFCWMQGKSRAENAIETRVQDEKGREMSSMRKKKDRRYFGQCRIDECPKCEWLTKPPPLSPLFSHPPINTSPDISRFIRLFIVVKKLPEIRSIWWPDSLGKLPTKSFVLSPKPSFLCPETLISFRASF